MSKKPSAYYRPKTLDEALRLLAQPDTVALAGGTTLLAADVTGGVVDLQELGLNQVWLEEGRLHVGAMTRLTDLSVFLASEDGENDCSALLRKALHQAGPNTFRNAATIGGTIAARLPDSELLAALLVLNPELELRSADTPTMELAEYFNAQQRPTGLITEISLAWERGYGQSERVARTPADYPIVSVTLWHAAGQNPHLAATGIENRPVRLAAAEISLVPGISDETIEQAAASAKAQANHPGDFRGDAEYRADMVAVLTRRVLAGA